MYPLVIIVTEHPVVANRAFLSSYPESYPTVTQAEYTPGKMAVRGMMNGRSFMTVFLDKVWATRTLSYPV
jgi:hypothetical protein